MTTQSVKIQIDDIILEGDLSIPEKTNGIVLFAHGSGSSRFSPRNRFVAGSINKKGLATLLFDLLTREEEAIDIQTTEFRFDIPLLAERLVSVTDWVKKQKSLASLKIGYFGSSTGAGAALIAASQCPEDIDAVVSRGGRVDLANAALPQVKAPTLMIVGSLDTPVIELNRQAQSQMQAKNQLEIVPGASHLFEEPGTLDKMTELACQWFIHYLS